MIYRTLHWYIFREMLRVFLLTASALTTMMAFGGMFQPLIKQGLEISQLLSIMFNLMPAMLAYAIPIAALFAAVLVYWRMSTDNELTACRAGGISFIAVVMPAFILGLSVASTYLVFANYVVPYFLQQTERMVRSDLGSILVAQVGRGESFDYDRLILYANQAAQKPGSQPGQSVVLLDSMAAALMGKDGKPSAIVVARQATLTITDIPTADSAEIEVNLVEAAVFDPKTFDKISGSFTTLMPEGRKLVVPSLFKTKPKFLNIRQLWTYSNHPELFPPVNEAIGRLAQTLRFKDVGKYELEAWKTATAQGKPLEFEVHDATAPTVAETLRVYAPQASLTPEHVLQFASVPGTPIRIEQKRNNANVSAYTCDSINLTLSAEELLSSSVSGVLELRGHVMQPNHTAVTAGPVFVGGIDIPPTAYASLDTSDPLKVFARGQVEAKNDPSVADPYNRTQREVTDLFQHIDSEHNSRGSFALACLTFVLLGAALGILMRGRNPLAVFVVGFVPAIVLVLLITAGRQLIEGSVRNGTVGIVTIWFGNVILLALVGIVYGKLLRQ